MYMCLNPQDNVIVIILNFIINIGNINITEIYCMYH